MTSNPDVPPFTGYVETTVNALRLIHAARQGVIPRITRRLNDSERRTMIKSGAVFVFSVEESGIKRWTGKSLATYCAENLELYSNAVLTMVVDGLLWSPSRIVSNFLVYREINERTSSRGNHKKPYPHDDSPTRALARKSSPDQQLPMGFKGLGGSDQGTFKVGGLIKKTITVTIEGSDLHLISYYTSEDIRSGKLKRPSSRPDIMSLYMPPHIFRLTNFRAPPKVEMGPDGKPKLVEAEDQELVDCKVEDSGYHIPASPSWSSQGSPTSPVENPFNGSSLYPLNSSHTGGSSSVYGRGVPSERWTGQNDGLVLPSRQDGLGWSPTQSTLTSAHSMGRRREGSVLHSDTWSSLQSQSGRWQGPSHESSSSSSSGGLYPERSRVRPSHLYDEGQIVPRKEAEVVQPTYPLRYTQHGLTGAREGALQRLHWHPRDTPDHSSRDIRRGTPHSASSFSSSPTLPYPSTQGYHSSTPTYTSAWTPNDTNLMSTPTLHTISTQSGMSYDGAYTSTSGSMPSPDEYNNVEEFRES
ncbi:Gti1/Pac2 family-domain-containing protein [Crassisporium funariophilum]|nr:Gti1/Pac2 family-domain-containing protein [Crassisporium funariophilum]